MKQDKFEIAFELTMAQVKELAIKSRMIYYGANTCWWTTEGSHLYKNSEHGLPSDPRGGVLFETKNVLDFLDSAEKNISHYGKYGLRAFLLAYHGCIVLKSNGFPTCFEKWIQYNELIDNLLNTKGLTQ